MSSRPAPIVVAAIAAESALASEEIAGALGHPRETGRDSTFPGRGATRVWADDRVVVKIRADLEAPQRDPARWVRGRLDRERELDAYPPDRTWFLLDRPDGSTSVGVAARRRRPLHLWSEDELRAAWTRYCRDFGELYVRAAVHDWRLDEGPSNFAWDGEGEGRLRYLDDDLYPWDRGVGLRLSWSVLARRSPWLGAEHAVQLGEAFRDALARAPLVLHVHELAADVGQGARGEFLPALAAALVAPARALAVPAPAARPTGRTAVLADIHGNLDALEVVLAEAEVREADEVLVLGDVVGYGPDNEECVRRVRALPNARVLRGNHEEATIDLAQAERFNRDARWAIDWCRERLSAESLAWIRSLPLELAGDGWAAVHGAFVDPARVNAYVYAQTADDNLDALELLGARVGFHGHSHVAGAWTRRRRPLRGIAHAPDAPLDTSRFAASLVCPGGLGQSRDGVPGAAYAMWDAATGLVEFRRIDYDTSGIRDRMARLGFPEGLRRRLETGR